MKSALVAGYTVETLLEVVSQPGIDVNALPPGPPKDALDCPLMDVLQWKGVLDADLPEFSLEGLHQYIIRFLVAEDVVSIFCGLHVVLTANICSGDQQVLCIAYQRMLKVLLRPDR